ncbi:uncharacterized protein LOC106667226 [Cimex lectularius]|uniref:Uncharacterized protein n=1 Tax=Cimex lectularius TaxID=79782 RepID=A0A8I6RUP9_CIMLE|nr:uncharacterized protein LOC106667226 [Cimex lectularius]
MSVTRTIKCTAEDLVKNWEDIDKLDFSPLDTNNHWGVIPQNVTLSLDFCEKVITAAVKPELPKLKLPVTEELDELYEYPPEIFPENAVIRHTILLKKHIKIMHELLDSINNDKSDIIMCPAIPEMVEQTDEANDFEGMVVKNLYKFQYGQGPDYPSLNDDVIHDMIKKSIIIILAQIGFDKAKKSVILVFVDVVKSWLRKITNVCNLLSQYDLNKDHVNYMDILDHAFNIMGLGSLSCVPEYYNIDVLGRRDRELAKSIHLVNIYTRIVSSIIGEINDEEVEPESSPKTETPMTTNITNISDSAQNLKPGFQPLHLIENRNMTGQPSQSDPVPGTSGITQTIRITPAQKKQRK